MDRRFWLVLLMLPLGCGDPGARSVGSSNFDATLLRLAGSYEKYDLAGRDPHLAPQFCAPPVAQVIPRLSSSGDADTHGRKLYWLFVKVYPAGAAPGTYTVAGQANPVGQAIVKEAWSSEERPVAGKPDEDAGVERPGQPRYPRRVVPVMSGGKAYHAGAKADLFIMFKLDPETTGTDEGWVYGTVTADGKTITSSGKVESCMGCHQKAPHDRLFGLPRE